jgi:7-cyano-7-deazaguanine synthase in queuosine biosynthesis
MLLSPASRYRVLLSGGVDSALVASLLCREGWSVQALWVDYGQPAAAAERAASRAIARQYGLEWYEAAHRCAGLRFLRSVRTVRGKVRRSHLQFVDWRVVVVGSAWRS